MKTCVVHPAPAFPRLDPDWNDPVWAPAETIDIATYRPESGAHRPSTQARLLHDARGIHGIFQVHDQYVRCLRTDYFDEVWKDSCVEFFVQPKPGLGYFNFEFNCGGAFLCSYIVNPERVPGGFKEYTPVSAALGQTVQVRSSLPSRVDPEIVTPLVWTLRFFIPFSLLEHYVGAIGGVAGQTWRGNLCKCADECSHPHWATWSPVPELNFHLPASFGTLRFA
jgi:hypothetical protein